MISLPLVGKQIVYCVWPKLIYTSRNSMSDKLDTSLFAEKVCTNSLANSFVRSIISGILQHIPNKDVA